MEELNDTKKVTFTKEELREIFEELNNAINDRMELAFSNYRDMSKNEVVRAVEMAKHEGLVLAQLEVKLIFGRLRIYD